jgi:hypothetical protein
MSLLQIAKALDGAAKRAGTGDAELDRQLKLTLRALVDAAQQKLITLLEWTRCRT